MMAVETKALCTTYAREGDKKGYNGLAGWTEPGSLCLARSPVQPGTARTGLIHLHQQGSGPEPTREAIMKSGLQKEVEHGA